MALRGFLNIDKPAGITSFDVVREIRRAAQIRKVGHAGTLDPAATGVLPLALGDATRLVGMLVGAPKRYLARVRFGITTDTYDADGEVTRCQDASGLTDAALRRQLDALDGEIMQVPPPFSAVKRRGVPAYRAARSGHPLRLEPRPVTIYGLSASPLDRSDPPHPELEIDVHCSRGFYVRALAHDLGQALGTGAHLAGLCRTAVGDFEVSRAVPLDLACELLRRGETEDLLHAIDSVLTGWPAVIVGRQDQAEVRQGRDIIARPRPGYRAPLLPEGEAQRARCYGPGGHLVALLEQGPAIGSWHPYRVIAAG